tara:strand:+ start:2292 stop:2582 length:291 start_codon:yes stop_codon:yes gene_type:complete
LSDIKAVANLKKIKGVLNKIMGDTSLGTKYINALDLAIKSLTKDEASLVTKHFSVSVQNVNEGIAVDVFYNKTGSIIESIEIDNDDIISEEGLAEA